MQSTFDLAQFQEFCKRQAALAGTGPAAMDVCPHCGGTGFHRQTRDGYDFIAKCSCRRAKELASAMARAGIPPKFRHFTLQANPTPDGREAFKPWGGGMGDVVAIESQKRAHAFCVKLRDLYADVFLHGKNVAELTGLLLYGECGRGKTMLATALLCDLIHMGLHDVRFIEYNELFKKIRFSFNSSELSYESIFAELTTAKVLVIDDFGLDVSDNLVWVQDNIGYIINERYTRALPTVLTTNFWRPLKEEPRGGDKDDNPYHHKSWEVTKIHQESSLRLETDRQADAFSERISYRLRSRITEMCYELKVEGYDYRSRLSNNRNLQIELARSKQKRTTRGDTAAHKPKT